MDQRHLSLETRKNPASKAQDSGNSVINKGMKGVRWRLDGSEVMGASPAGTLEVGESEVQDQFLR